jgi:hypothetical protein
MSKFQTLHSHHKNITDIFLHLLTPTLAYLASYELYLTFKLVDLKVDPIKFTNMIGGSALSFSALKYGLDGDIATKQVILTHHNGQEAFVTIKPEETWSDLIMKWSPALIIADLFTPKGGFAFLGGIIGFGLAAYEGFNNSPVKYDFYENDHKIDNLSISATGDQILENGISIPFTIIE